MADTINKTDLVAAIAAESGQSQAAVSGPWWTRSSTVRREVASKFGHQGQRSRAGSPFEQTHRAARAGPQPRDGRHHPDRRQQVGVKVAAGSKLKAAAKKLKHCFMQSEGVDHVVGALRRLNSAAVT